MNSLALCIPILGRLFTFLLATLLVCSIGLAQSSRNAIANSPQGFDKQYHQLLKACRKYDEQEIRAEFDKFALPSDWFIEEFGSDFGPELQKKYSEQFEAFRSSTFRSLRAMLCPWCLVSLTTKLVYSTEAKVLAEREQTSADPFGLPPLERFEIRYTGQRLTEDGDGTGHTFTPLGNYSWMDSYIYLDGAFRFFGRGAQSFLEPVRVRLADPCSPEGTQPGGHLLHNVEPIYPEETRKKDSGRFVRVLVTVAEDGSVKDVKVMERDKAVVQAIRQAVMQWRFTPFMNCGKPVEMQTFERVRFSANQ